MKTKMFYPQIELVEDKAIATVLENSIEIVLRAPRDAKNQWLSYESLRGVSAHHNSETAQEVMQEIRLRNIYRGGTPDYDEAFAVAQATCAYYEAQLGLIMGCTIAVAYSEIIMAWRLRSINERLDKVL